jgi:hypothetical protein
MTGRVGVDPLLGKLDDYRHYRLIAEENGSEGVRPRARLLPGVDEVWLDSKG